MPKKILHLAAAQLKFRPTVGENLEVIRRFVGQAAEEGVDAVLFPECALTGYNIDFRRCEPREIEDGLAVVAQAARAHRVNVLIGTPTFARGKWFNSLVVFDRRGRERFRYHKIQLTPREAGFFQPGNAVAFFHLDGVPCTAILCHERRYPELVRLPVMMGAQVVFHANAGLDSLALSKTKRGGRDGIAIRAFENLIYYVFANFAGPQGDGFWSAGDSKIVGPDSRVLALANHRDERLIHAECDLSTAARTYARDALQQPAFLRKHWKAMVAACRDALKRHSK